MAITFNIVGFKDQSGGAGANFQVAVQRLLDATGVELSNHIANSGALNVLLTIVPPSAFIASAGVTGYQSNGTLVNNRLLAVSTVESKLIRGVDEHNSSGSDINLSVSADFFKLAGASDAASAAVMTHEMIHALGFLTNRSVETGALGSFQTAFDSHVSITAGQPFFVGDTARGIFGGDVPLAKLGEPGVSIGHVLISDVTNGEGKPDLMAEVYAGDAAHISSTDLAVLKDVGYSLSHNIVSLDGHTFAPGAGAQTLTGFADLGHVNTVVMGAKSSDFVQTQVAGHLVESSKLHSTDVNTFVGIDRIKFSDVSFALDDVATKIDGFYHAAFGRAPDLQGMGYWLAQVDHGMAIDAVAKVFQSTKEFAATPDTVAREVAFDTTGHSGQVSRLYQTVFARTADLDGLKYWNGKLGSGWSLEDVATAFQSTPEFAKANPTTMAYVTHLYENALHRAPDAGGLAYWMHGIDAPLTSPEHLSSAHLTVFFSELSATGEVVGAINTPVPYIPFLT